MDRELETEKRGRLATLLIGSDRNLEKRNMLWNMVGSFCYAFASMVLSFLVMRIAGEEQGGIFAFGYSTLGQQMFLIAYFGIRPFQITDGAGEYSFGDYFGHRCLTCTAAVCLGAVYLLFQGYSREKLLILLLLIAYKTADGFADVYESEFQRQGRLYLTGKSNAFRTMLSVGVFLAALEISKNLLSACLAALMAQVLGIVLFDVLVLRALQVERKRNGKGLQLTRATLLLFLSVFLDFYVFSAAKYAIDSHLGDAASGYFNIIFMPTSVINLAAGFVIRPFLTELTAYWGNGDFRAFSGKLVRLTGLIAALGAVGVAGACLLGKPVLSFLEILLGSAYTGGLTLYHRAFVLIVLGGVFYALLNLYYYALVIMRCQRMIFGIYLVMALVAWVGVPPLVMHGQIPGAAVSYLILMVMMAGGFVSGGWRKLLRSVRMAKDIK